MLVPLAPEFPARIAPGGALILSGLLPERRRSGDARLPRRRASPSTRAATRTSGPRCACRSRGAVSVSRAAAVRSARPPARHAHHRRRRRAPSPRARAARAAGRRDHAVRRRGRRGGRRASCASDATETELAPDPARAGGVPCARRARATPLVLLTAVPRGGRMDFLVQKCSELGVSRIVPIIAARSVARPEPGAARALGKDRARGGPAVRAGGRSGGVDAPAPLAAALAAPELARTAARAVARGGRAGRCARCCPIAAADGAAGRAGRGPRRRRESRRRAAAGFVPVSLGSRILRVETAAIVAVALAEEAFGALSPQERVNLPSRPALRKMGP